MAPSNWNDMANSFNNEYDRFKTQLSAGMTEVRSELNRELTGHNGYSGNSYYVTTSSGTYEFPVALVAGVAGGIALLIVLIVLCCCCCKRSTRGRVILGPPGPVVVTTPAQAPYNVHEHHNPLAFTHPAPVAVAVYPVGAASAPPGAGVATVASGAPAQYPLYPHITYASEHPPAYDSDRLLLSPVGDTK